MRCNCSIFLISSYISGCMGISVAHPLSTFHFFLRGIRTVSLITGRGTSTFAPPKTTNHKKDQKNETDENGNQPEAGAARRYASENRQARRRGGVRATGGKDVRDGGRPSPARGRAPPPTRGLGFTNAGFGFHQRCGGRRWNAAPTGGRVAPRRDHRQAAGGDGTPPLPTAATERGPPRTPVNRL